MHILKVENLVKRFGGLAAVNGVSFEVKKGEILALIGPNGAGKTTCFNMIAGYMPPTEGRVSFNGKDVTGQKPYTLNAQGLARTFQVVKPLAKLSVFDNVMVACLSKSRNTKEAREKARVMLDRTNLAAMQDTLAGSLSIGNLKRLEVARALATQPTLLLMDEPMGGLTPAEVDKAIELIHEINRDGVSIVIIEHIMKAVMAVAHSIVVLQNGEPIARGKPEDVVKDEQVIKAYLGEGYAANR
ncbi:ABC transporter ATP-binding protein [Pollutimonas harenae]|uniref:ABC transporter ATP-binding protein n=1 Tax=Pollutimonas harenae TaxID=657015 RepID=A0A853GZ97_9BURK|nr:ABC transporter ATP-binding protein [Pollutimonas harenae]NYT84375.1 ABC transporter ATP-binding protein [Pollutimonas harenae]TEA73224.1 ABC transporter ATP-binding protein [Pollutimonas harenae]